VDVLSLYLHMTFRRSVQLSLFNKDASCIGVEPTLVTACTLMTSVKTVFENKVESTAGSQVLGSGPLLRGTVWPPALLQAVIEAGQVLVQESCR
jgi:hypothetical protein